MRNLLLAGVIQVPFILVCFEALAADPASLEKTAPGAVHGYSSPQEAFNAMRTADGRRDWRTVFLSLTPANQDDSILGLFDTCMFCCERNEELRIVMKKHGLELGRVAEEYSKEYLQKHGVDLEKLSAEAAKRAKEHLERYLKAHPEIANQTSEGALAVPYEPGEEQPPSLPPVDEELMSRVVLRLVTDKAGFYEQGREAVTPKIKDILEPDLGNLEGLKVPGDAATGWVTETTYHLHGEPGKPDVKEADAPHRVECCFRNLNGRWYNGQ
jgi:hypothetical protein